MFGLFRTKPITVLSSCAILCACATNPDVELVRSLPEDVQRAAVLECASELGVPAQIKVVGSESSRSVFTVNGNGVSIFDARKVNICAYDKLIARYS